MVSYLVWTLVASVVGFAITAVSVGGMQMRRTTFLVPYVLIVGLLLYGFVRWAQIDVVALLINNLLLAVVATVVVSFILVGNVLRQPAVPRTQGPRFVFELLWFGLVYGAVDGLYLSVFPVLLAWVSFPTLRTTPVGLAAIAVLGLVSSVVVTVSYHAGYPEFRSLPMLRMAAFGNAVISLGFILSMNPIAAFASHAVMHTVAVWHGSEGTVQLPPHYRDEAAAAAVG